MPGVPCSPFLLTPPGKLLDPEAHGDRGVLLVRRLALPPPRQAGAPGYAGQRAHPQFRVRIDANAPPPTGRFILVEPKPEPGLVEPKKEPGLPAEYEEIARRGFSDEDAMRWAWDDYLRDEMVR